MQSIQDNYQKNTNNVIKHVKPGSIAEEVGLEPGDTLIAIDNVKVRDILDYYFLTSDQALNLLIEKKSGAKWLIEIEKDFDERLGIAFAHSTISPMKHCQNNCIFCFIDQLPKGMRKSLYVKDDDYRLSPLHGNYVTLTNITAEEIQRLINYKLSPLYISVHATNESVRRKMLNHPNAGDLLTIVNDFAQAGIEMHGQIVLCPGYNDQKELSRTIYDLVKFFPQFKSLAVVPVGLTKHRKHSNQLTPVSQDLASSTIEQVERIQTDLYTKLGTRFVFLADEFYIKAGLDFPAYQNYEDFSQLENGVGLVKLFEHEIVSTVQQQAQSLNLDALSGTILTSKDGAFALNHIFNNLKKATGVTLKNLHLMAIENHFFGPQVTVTGLVTGSDIIKQLRQHRAINSPVYIPDIMLKDESSTFLDGVTIDEIEEKFSIEIKKVPTSGKQFIDFLVKN